MTANPKQAPRAFSWARPLAVNAWLALTFIVVLVWNLATAGGPAFLQPNLLALTVAFLVVYSIRFHPLQAISIRQWMLISAIAIAFALVVSGAEYALTGH
ncbi:MAG: hypothetical protein DI533_21715 [Cereibacter sphaeroides]|uniref:Uncharacterized protein n=1 Tax=Cereibacter sphaeroides TaxID=1063 RepID=A0A2W5S0R0_CERSP|nr:MAG: hypothetical protein DI533_21715 [Cereibacter sphaeroides]